MEGVGLAQSRRKEANSDLIAACSYLKGSCKHDEAKLFLTVTDGITRDNDLKLWLGSFRLEVSGWTHTQEGNTARTRLLRRVVEPPRPG